MFNAWHSQSSANLRVLDEDGRTDGGGCCGDIEREGRRAERRESEVFRRDDLLGERFSQLFDLIISIFLDFIEVKKKVFSCF